MKTHYLCIEWLHTAPDEPVRLYHELDAERYERRKVEEYRDGTLHSADALHGQGSTFLAWEQHPLVAEIEQDPQFHVSKLTAQDFERVWQRAASHAVEPAAV